MQPDLHKPVEFELSYDIYFWPSVAVSKVARQPKKTASDLQKRRRATFWSLGGVSRGFSAACYTEGPR